MKSILVPYISSAIVFVGLDFLWLSFMGGILYRPVLGEMMLDKPNLAPAAVFYLLYIAGIFIFAISPALSTGRWTTALVYGALFGLFCYATYDLTNQATLKNWSTTITLVDIAWGSFVTSASAIGGYICLKNFA